MAELKQFTTISIQSDGDLVLYITTTDLAVALLPATRVQSTVHNYVIMQGQRSNLTTFSSSSS